MLVQAAVFMGLWLTDTELNITSIMGMTMIVGIVTEVAIFYYSEFAGLPDEQAATRDFAAGVNRMRAITMTTLPRSSRCCRWRWVWARRCSNRWPSLLSPG